MENNFIPEAEPERHYEPNEDDFIEVDPEEERKLIDEYRNKVKQASEKMGYKRFMAALRSFQAVLAAKYGGAEEVEKCLMFQILSGSGYTKEEIRFFDFAKPEHSVRNFIDNLIKENEE